MIKVTYVGKYLRKLRIEKDIKLKDMSKTLNVSQSYLSSIELGKKNINEKLTAKIIDEYKLNETEIKEFKFVIDKSNGYMIIKLSSYDEEMQDYIIKKINMFIGMI